MVSILKVLLHCFLMYKQLNVAESAKKYTCEVPDSWQTVLHSNYYDEGAYYSEQVAALNLRGDRDPNLWLWPNAVVPYTIDQKLSQMDQKEVFKAFDEYHTKTCIRFVHKQASDKDFVNIEINNTRGICGIAQVGRIGGYQWAQFGNTCKAAKVMIHELGHTLGLSHENQRQDRDNYMKFPNCDPKDKSRIFPNTQASGLYDYQSIMHYQCHNCHIGFPIYSKEEVPSCGMDSVRGLSVLDADHINSLYNCEGCLSHRWRNVHELTDEDIANIKGGRYPQFRPVTPCRTLIQGQVAVGHIDLDQRDASCIIPYLNQVYPMRDHIEVLVIPNVPWEGCRYTLEASSTVSLANAVVAAAKNYDTRNLVYIAYTKNGIGEVLGFGGYFAQLPEIPVGNTVVNPREFYVLTCSCLPSTTAFPPPPPGVIPAFPPQPSPPRGILYPIPPPTISSPNRPVFPFRTTPRLPRRGAIRPNPITYSRPPNWGLDDDDDDDYDDYHIERQEIFPGVDYSRSLVHYDESNFLEAYEEESEEILNYGQDDNVWSSRYEENLDNGNDDVSLENFFQNQFPSNFEERLDENAALEQYIDGSEHHDINEGHLSNDYTESFVENQDLYDNDNDGYGSQITSGIYGSDDDNRFD